ncbi:MAG TPA: AbrB/MazE/SpoVT family DNA-binding domain-containing protein [Candidatus Angelobacter sp.]|jgi:antitoxin component of MazEF toxin-antitoxin module|nr:AbrB/MazE/SpoVT family DNA-binding domain-containing protein [Candidatus Angelobacter sp.]
MAIRTVVRKWGNSLGVVIPSEEASKEGLRENDEVEVVIRKALDIRELFGKYKFRDLQKLKEELREGWA